MKWSQLRRPICLLALVLLVLVVLVLPRLASRGPAATAMPPVEPPAMQPLHLRNFSHLHWPAACDSRPLVVVALIADPSSFVARAVRRRLFCSVAEYRGSRLRCLFVLGVRANATVQRRVDAEAAATGDILQLSFADTYKNLTYKALAILDWTVAACPSAQFVMKADLDTMVNPFNLVDLVLKQKPSVARRLYGGYRNAGVAPLRNVGFEKWRVTKEEFPGDRFPTYATGLGMIFSRQAAAELLRASDTVPLFKLEDVYIGMCAEKAGLDVADFRQFFSGQLQGNASHWCSYRTLVAVHRVADAAATTMWRLMAAPAEQRPKC